MVSVAVSKAVDLGSIPSGTAIKHQKNLPKLEGFLECIFLLSELVGST